MEAVLLVQVGVPQITSGWGIVGAKMTHAGNAWVAVEVHKLKRAESTSSKSAGFDVIQEPDTLFISWIHMQLFYLNFSNWA